MEHKNKLCTSNQFTKKGGENINKNRTDIAYQIATELLEQDALDLNNFGYDADSLISFVQEIILYHLKDYLIVSGTLL